MKTGGASWADRSPESNLDATKIKNKLTHFQIYKKRKKTKILNGTTLQAPSLAEEGARKRSLMNQVSSGVMTMSVKELYTHNIFSFKP